MYKLYETVPKERRVFESSECILLKLLHSFDLFHQPDFFFLPSPSSSFFSLSLPDSHVSLNVQRSTSYENKKSYLPSKIELIGKDSCATSFMFIKPSDILDLQLVNKLLQYLLHHPTACYAKIAIPKLLFHKCQS